MKQYSDADLVAIGRKAVAARDKQAVKDKENRDLFRKVMAAVKEGKIKLPK